MENSWIRIEIQDTSSLLNESFEVDSSNIEFLVSYTFVNLRTRPTQTTLDDTSTPPANLSNTAYNLFNSAVADYESTGLYEVFRIGSNVVKIQSKRINTIFNLTSAPVAGLDIQLFNFSESENINLNTTNFLAATTNDPCEYVKVQFDLTKTASKITAPILVDPNNDNPIEFEFIRGGTNASITVEDPDNSSLHTFNTTTPDILSVDNIDISVLEAPAGATITTTVSNVDKLDIEYSLNDIDWQGSNVFNGIVLGSYTMYVRDQLGCKVSKTFEVTGLTPGLDVTEPFELVSSENSIIFAKRITYGICSDFPNSENQLSCEEFINEDVKYKTVHLYNNCDLIETQFKSNYDNLEVKTIDEEGNEDIMPIVKVTSNLAREDSRDAIVYNLGDGKAGVYYMSGNTYDFQEGGVTGTYALNGNLPEYSQIGNYIFLEGYGYFIIENIITDLSVNARVLVISLIYTLPPLTIIVKSQYSVANFEVYEFTLDMSFYINKTFSVKISMTHPLSNFPNITYLSEKINVKNKQTAIYPNQLLSIEFWNTDNGEILYIDDEGDIRIKHKILAEVESISIASQDDIEVQNTDTTSILLNASIYQGDEFVFSPVPTEMARRLRNALVHNVVNINGIGYVPNDIPEVERLGQSNLYTVTAVMIRTGKIYNTTIQGVGNEVPEETEVIRLLTGSTGFVKSS